MTSVPVSYRLDPAAGIVRVEVSGRPGFDEETGIYRLFRRDPAYRPGMPILVDDRGREAAADLAEVRALGDVVRHSPANLTGIRCALLVASDLQYGMSRVWAARVAPSGLVVEVFRSELEALDWLQVKPAG